MAARRLVIVMLILLGVSLVAGALAPQPVEESEPEETVTTPPASPRPDDGGRLVEERIDADAKRRKTISIRVGDQLALTVRAGEADEVEIAGFGELRFAAPLAPARFDLLATEEATHPVRLVEGERVIGRIEVRPSEDDQAEDSGRLTTDGPGTRGGERADDEDE